MPYEYIIYECDYSRYLEWEVIKTKKLLRSPLICGIPEELSFFCFIVFRCK